jgi:hypothetical protein
MFEVEAVDGVPRLQARQAEAALNGVLVAGFQFQVRERFQSLRKAQVFGCRVASDLIELAAHRRQCQLIQFLVQMGHAIPFVNEE